MTITVLETTTEKFSKLKVPTIEHPRGEWSMIADLSDFSLRGFPHVVKVFSPETGRVATFEPDLKEAERNEFWDGEQMEYISKDEFATHIHLTLVND